ncbi:hypothetical protein L3V86_04050 [Thiotrichales bacterium 19S11-10]|nr:hypothetical protein [Thiotrichales bacterium 19S11-10]
MIKIFYSVFISFCLTGILTADQSQTDTLIKKIDILQQQLDTIDQKISQLSTKEKSKEQVKKTPLLSPLDKQAASSAIFIPGGQPKPLNDKTIVKKEDKIDQVTRDKPDTSSTDTSSNHTDSNSNSQDLSDSSDLTDSYGTNYDYDDSNYSTPLIQSNRRVVLSLDSYTNNTYQYDTSTSTVSFVFLSDVILNLKFNGFSVYNLKICNSSYASCISVTQTDTNQYQLTTDQLNAVSSNLGTSQITLSSEIFMVPIFYLTYTPTSNSSTVLTGYFSFPTSSSNMSCSTSSSTATCQLTQSSQVSFITTS